MTRTEMLDIIMLVKQWDQDHARELLREMHALVPWLDLVGGIRERLENEK